MRTTLWLVFSLLCVTVANAQQVAVPFASDKIQIGNYDDKVHGSAFALADPTLKRVAIVLTNNNNQPLVAAHIHGNGLIALASQGNLCRNTIAF
jgi:hypothetical protein